VLGDPTEGALLVAAAKAALTKEDLEPEATFECENPFDGDRKMMSMIRRTPRGRMLYAKGAPDVLLNRCTHHLTLDGRTESLSERDRSAVLSANSFLAHETLRVLAGAFRSMTDQEDTAPANRSETALVFLGLFAMKDPLRPEAAKAVARCHQAGVLTVMITGDHKETAAAIGQELGLRTGDGAALSGAELDKLTDQQLADSVELVSVFARVSAEHKLRIIKAWKSRGAIVAMTGDGVNDAPAVKAADIGVAMGIAGTDVTKEAADMVVTDDNFASIAAAVEEGRGVFDNIRKTVHFLLSCNASEVLVMLFAALFNLPLPLLPIQILWMNFITDGIPALALAADPKAPDLMRRPPRSADAPLLDGQKVVGDRRGRIDACVDRARRLQLQPARLRRGSRSCQNGPFHWNGRRTTRARVQLPNRTLVDF
jgi:Ca2+-transporting ATPase